MSYLYLAVWPNLTFSFIQAASEDEAYLELDQLGPPGSAKITRYNGPLFLDCGWQLDEDDHAEMPSMYCMPCGDQAIDMHDEVLEFGFPHLYAYYEAVWKDGKEPSLDEARAALSLDEDTFPGSTAERIDLEDFKDAFDD